MDQGLNKQIVKGVSWNFVETLSVYAARFVIGIVLARILFPADFGLIGMITIFISISDVFVNAGFGQAFIQKKDATKTDANTVFTINFILGAVTYVVLFFLAPFIAEFFNQPVLVSLVRVLSVVLIINSLNVIQLSLIRKEFQFKKRAVLTIISTAIGGITGITCAYKGLGVWSLVIQQLSNRLTLCGLLYVKSKWRLKFKYSHDSARQLFRIGSWMLCANLTLTVFNNLYRFVIGKLYSDVQLGLYERAKQFETMVADTFTMVLGNVSFPVFAKIQDSPEELEHTTGNFIKYSCIIIFPILSCLMVVARPFICWLITSKWLMAVPYLQLLCIIGFLVPVNFFIGQLLQAIGKTKLVFYYTLCLSGLRILNVVVSNRFGVPGIIIGEGCVIIIATVSMSFYSRKILGFNYLGSLKSIIGLSLQTAIGIIVGLWMMNLTGGMTNFMQMLVCTCSMMIVFLGWLFIFEKKTANRLLCLFSRSK